MVDFAWAHRLMHTNSQLHISISGSEEGNKKMSEPCFHQICKQLRPFLKKEGASKLWDFLQKLIPSFKKVPKESAVNYSYLSCWVSLLRGGERFWADRGTRLPQLSSIAWSAWAWPQTPRGQAAGITETPGHHWLDLKRLCCQTCLQVVCRPREA